MTSSDSKKVKVIDIRNFKQSSELDDFLDSNSSKKQGKELEESDSDEFNDFQSGGNSEDGNQKASQIGGDNEEASDIEEEESSADEDSEDQDDSEEDSEEDKDDSEEDSEGDQDGGASVTSTTRMLSEDPLFLVLSEYFVNKKGRNIVTVLDKINNNLSKLVKYLKD